MAERTDVAEVSTAAAQQHASTQPSTTTRHAQLSPGDRLEVWLAGERFVVASKIVKGRKPSISITGPPSAMISLLTKPPKSA